MLGVTQVLIGTRGWDYPLWTPDFYPPELPPEWRLTFYANNFNSVLVPARDWMEPPLARLEQWLMDTGDTFRFMLELPPGADDRECEEIHLRAQVLSPRLSGFVASDILAPEQIAMVLPEWPLAARLAAPDVRAHPTAQSLGVCWEPLKGSPWAVSAPLLVSLVAGGADRDMVDAVRRICDVAHGFRVIALFADGTPSAARKLRAATVLLGLLEGEAQAPK